MTADAIEKGKKDGKPNIFVRMGKRISRFFREYKSEVKKITWPDFKTVVKKTFVVFVVVLVVGIGIWLLILSSHSLSILPARLPRKSGCTRSAIFP